MNFLPVLGEKLVGINETHMRIAVRYRDAQGVERIKHVTLPWPADWTVEEVRP